ncbi:polysaccharide deacetylase family protein [Streptomyces sp. NBC_00370]|uniref:polysaccharide deacetylase family protein n=1 Tax=Streptomyces sp. NBC_00370 TaxID=2975728 RepID=UPI003FA781ED
MQLVRQKEDAVTKGAATARLRAQARARLRGVRRTRTALAVLLVAAIGSGCAAGADGAGGGPTSRPMPLPLDVRPITFPPAAPASKPALRPVPAKPAAGPQAAQAAQALGGPAGAVAAQADLLKRGQLARVALAKKWGLRKVPLLAPPPPAVKPKITTRKGFEVRGGDAGLPPVFTTVPVKDKVVFLTMDDGAEKDPELLRMMSELRIPYSAFLSDYLISDDYGYFKKAQNLGVSLNNHTLHHLYLPKLTPAQQRHEICDQQDKLAKHYGKRPTLFRPPFGNYNADTLRIAKACGVTAVPLWETEAFPDHMDWRDADQHLDPGDIILTHFRGRSDWKASMPDLIRSLLKRITDSGFAVAKLEDYV